MDGKILDNNSFDVEKNKIHNFQVIEFGLIALLLLLMYFIKALPIPYMDKLTTIVVFIIPVFSAIRIYFEYKNKLITGFGVVLKVYLMINAFVIFTGVLFQILAFPYANELFTLSLMSLTIPYILYAFALKNVSILIKLILSFSSFALCVLAIGVLFTIESWPWAFEMNAIGVILVLVSLPVFGFISRMKMTNKEKYHSINYFGRAIAVIIAGIFIL